MSERNQFKS